MIESFWQDIRHAARSLRRTPAFTAAAIITLALGIGANTAIFSFVEAVLLRTLPLSQPEDLYFIAHGVTEPVDNTSSNYPYFERLRDRRDVFAGVTAYSTETFKVSIGESVEATPGEFVSGNYHGLLGVRMALGRGFTAEDDRGGTNALIAVIGDSYWTTRFGRDPNVIGKTLIIEGRPTTIVGVTAPGFDGLQSGRRAEITLPLGFQALEDPGFLTAHDNLTSMPLVARPQPGVTEAHARGAVASVLQQYLSEPENQWWQRGRNGEPRSAGLLPAARGSDSVREDYSTALTVLMAIVGLVLVIGCANVANLLLARASARAKEVALRLSLGAGRTRLIGQFLAESMLLALAGGAVGFVLAWWGTKLIASLFAIGENPLIVNASPNTVVLIFTFAVSALTGVLFGMAPALNATRVDLTAALKESGALACARRRGWSGRQLLVAGQIALCVVLMTGAGLLVRTFRNLQAQDIGFDRSNVLMFGIDVEGTPVPAERLPQLCDELLDRLAAHPGVTSASCSTSVPVRGSGSTRGLTLPGLAPAQPPRDAFSNQVTADYFRTFGLTLVRGRLLSERDTATSEKVVVINERFAREYYGDADPLGRTVQFGSRDPRAAMTIVGIVRDTAQFNNLRDAPPRTLYTPLEQEYDMPTSLTVGIRATASPAVLTGSVRADVSAISGDIVVEYIRTMEQQISAMLVRERVLAALSTWFGVLALVLACVGLYGVMAYDVSRRTRDIGIRLALGAEPAHVRRRVLRQVAALTAVGVAIGVAAAFGTTRVLSDLLFGLSARDPLTLTAAAGLLTATALIAGYLPARRAASVDPVTALRAE